jgi:hypothetical protein
MVVPTPDWEFPAAIETPPENELTEAPVVREIEPAPWLPFPVERETDPLATSDLPVAMEITPLLPLLVAIPAVKIIDPPVDSPAPLLMETEPPFPADADPATNKMSPDLVAAPLLKETAPDNSVASPLERWTAPLPKPSELAKFTEPEYADELDPVLISINPPVSETEEPALISIDPPSPLSLAALPA